MLPDSEDRAFTPLLVNVAGVTPATDVAGINDAAHIMGAWPG